MSAQHTTAAMAADCDCLHNLGPDFLQQWTFCNPLLFFISSCTKWGTNYLLSRGEGGGCKKMSASEIARPFAEPGWKLYSCCANCDPCVAFAKSTQEDMLPWNRGKMSRGETLIIACLHSDNGTYTFLTPFCMSEAANMGQWILAETSQQPLSRCPVPGDEPLCRDA